MMRVRQSVQTWIAAVILGLLVLCLAWAPSSAQDKDGKSEPLSQAQIEQLVASIALYPDDLVSQILMASTYPLEVVEAARWVKKNPGLTGKALEDALAKQTWDPSVKSLAALPEVLEMMNDRLSWTQQLGDAFLAQQKEVLAAVQSLRAKAEAEGSLASTEEQKVEKQTVTTDSGAQQSVIVIQPTDPDVIYVPAYDPAIVYGTWPYASYPPYYWYPPGYVAGRALWFATGVAVGAAIWGRCDWGYGRVTVNVNSYNSFNRTNINSANWQHDAVHRKGVPYQNRDVAARYGKGGRDARAREQFRGRADAGRRELAARQPGAEKRPGADKRPSANKRPGTDKRPATARPAAKRPQKTAKRSAPAKRPAAYKGVGKGKQVRQHSARGKKSRHASRSRGGGRTGGGRRGGGRRR